MSAAPTNVKVQITTAANTAGVQQTASSLGQVQAAAGRVAGSFDRARAAADRFIDSIKLGVGIDIGGRLVQGLAQLPALFQQMTRDGIRFNSTLESSRIAIAGMLRANAPAQYSSWGNAFSKAGEMVDLLRQKALTTTATFEELLDVYSANASLAFSAGITDLKQQLDLIVTISSAVKSMGLPGPQMMQEVRALMTGNVNPRYAQVAASRGIDTESWKRAQGEGRLYEYLSERFASTKEQMGEAMQGYSGLSSNLEDALTALKAAASEPLFNALKESFAELIETFKSPEAKRLLTGLVGDFGHLASGILKLVDMMARGGPVLGPLVTWLGRLGLAVVGVKLSQLILGLGLSTAAWLRKTVAVSANTAAVAANTAAVQANAAAQATGAAASAAPRRGFLSAGNVGGAAGWGVGLGLMANMWISSKAQEQEQRSGRQRALGADLDSQFGRLHEDLTTAKTAERQREVARAIEETVEALREKRALEEDGESVDLLDSQIGRVEALLRNFDRLKGTEEARQTLEGKIAADMERQAASSELIGKVEDYRIGQAPDDATRKQLLQARAQRLHSALGDRGLGSDRGASGDWIAETELLGKQAIERFSEDELKAVNEQIDQFAETMREIADLDAAAAEDAKKVADARAKATEENERDLEIAQMRAAGNEQGAALLEREREIRKEAAKLQEDLGVSEAEALLRARARVAAERNIADAKKVADLNAARSDYNKELAILAARASGDEERATQLERQRDLEREIAQIKEQQGLTDEEARAVAERKLALNEQIAERAKEEEEREKAREEWTPAATVRSTTGRDEHRKQRKFDVYGREITWAEEGTTLARPSDMRSALTPKTWRPFYASSMVTDRGVGASSPDTATAASGESIETITSGVRQLDAALKSLGTTAATTTTEATKAAKTAQDATARSTSAVAAVNAAVAGAERQIIAALRSLEARVKTLEAGI